MKGQLSYQTSDPEMPNSIEGWFIHAEKPYLASEGSVKKIKRGKYNHLNNGKRICQHIQ